VRIAVIGSGISGMVAARSLHREHAITVFEAGDYIGGHTNTVDIEWAGEQHAIDTGFIVFNDRTYPHFVRLLDELGVASTPTSMSFSVRADAARLEYNGTDLNGLFAQRSNLFRPSFHRMIRDILRFHREAAARTSQPDRGETVADFLAAGSYSIEFAQHYLLPMGSAIWSCPTGTFGQFPIQFIVEFFQNHGLLSLRDRPTWRVVTGGSRSYVDALIRPFRDSIRLSTPVVSVSRTEDAVQITPLGGSAERFDHVIFACHSDQALAMLRDPTATEQELLRAFPYGRNTAVLHTDASLLPRHRRAWASWNYLVRPDRPESATVTYHMNLLQHLKSQHQFCVTLNGDELIDPARVLRTFVYHHPVFTVHRADAQRRHAELLNVHRTSYCGAYWGNGFHEDGVASALAVSRALKQPTRCTVASTKEACGIGG